MLMGSGLKGVEVGRRLLGGLVVVNHSVPSPTLNPRPILTPLGLALALALALTLALTCALLVIHVGVRELNVMQGTSNRLVRERGEAVLEGLSVTARHGETHP